jgi:hypothetical protein
MMSFMNLSTSTFLEKNSSSICPTFEEKDSKIQYDQCDSFNEIDEIRKD